jgi:uncharacterized protein (TIGR03437 family)
MMREFCRFSVLLALAASCPGQSAADLFDGSVLQEIRLTMAPADWQTLHDKYLDKKAVYKCEFAWRGFEVKNVGLHTRGTGSLNPIKPGLGIEFAQYDSTQRFLGFSSLILRNFSQDPSTLHETLTMRMFERLGLPFQRTVHARMLVNGSYVGLYEMVEPIDDRYLVTRFGEDTGYLYEAKGGQNFHWQYLGDSPSAYVSALFDPKTHTNDPQGQVIADMVRTINLSTDAEFVAAVSRYMDIGAYVAHVAVEIFMGEADGILSDSGMANFYLYRRTADDHWFLLPWDKEMTFVRATWPIFEGTNDDVLLRRALLVPEFRGRYLDTLHQAAEAAGGPGGWLSQEFERKYEQVREAVLQDPNRVCDVDGMFAACPQAAFQVSIDYSRAFVQERPAFVTDAIVTAGWRQQALNLRAGAVTNGASGVTVLAPGELAFVSVQLPLSGVVGASAWPLPRELGGVSVSIGGTMAPMVTAAATGAWIQTPSELPMGPTSAKVVGTAGASQTIAVELRPAAPGVFAVTHADGSVVDASSSARAGELVVVWATGLGHAVSDEQSGQSAPMDRLVTMKNAVTATVGGQGAEVLWAGLAPGFAALQQVVVRLPAGLAGGNPQLSLNMFGEPGAGFALPVR